MSKANDDARERFDRQLLDPCLLSSFFSSDRRIPSFELDPCTSIHPTSTNHPDKLIVAVHDDYLDLRRQQNANFAEKQLQDGTQAMQQGNWNVAKQHFQQGLNMIPSHEALQQVMQQLHSKVKPALASKSERNLRNAALEVAFRSEAPRAAVASNDPKYPILNDDDDDDEEESEASRRRHRKQSKKRKKEKHKKKTKKRRKEKRRKRHRSNSSSSMSSVTEAPDDDDDPSLSSRKRNRMKDDDYVRNENSSRRHNGDSQNTNHNNNDDDDDEANLALQKERMQSGAPNKRKYEEDDSPNSLGTVDSLQITRKKQRHHEHSNRS